jgi:hypothetical protein
MAQKWNTIYRQSWTPQQLVVQTREWKILQKPKSFKNEIEIVVNLFGLETISTINIMKCNKDIEFFNKNFN